MLWLKRGLPVVVALAAFVLGWWYSEKPPVAAAPVFGGDFVLQGAAGPVALEDFRDQVVLLQFGYTHCPDICPGGLAKMAAALTDLTPAEQEAVQPFFITVDGARDSHQRLTSYLSYFYPRLVGLRGSEADIRAVADRYKLHYERVEYPDSAAGYGYDHSALTFVLDRRGKIHGLVPHSMTVLQLRQSIQAALLDLPGLSLRAQ